MKYVDIRDLPPCSFSPQCLRLIDDLDLPPAAPASTRLAYIEDLQDERQLRQLRSHVPGCPTCSALLVEARRMRTQQRMMLYHLLVANERQVPATSGAIFEAIRRESRAEEEAGVGAARKADARGRDERGLKRVSPDQDAIFAFTPIPLSTRAAHPRRIFQNMLTLATVAAVILAAIGLINRFTVRTSSLPGQSSQTSHPGQTPSPSTSINNEGWDSVVIGMTLLSTSGLVKSWSFYNYDTSGGQMETMGSATQTAVAVDMEGISSNGLNVLYDETWPNQQKTYSTLSVLPGAVAHRVYQLGAGQGGNAVWMDATHVLVQNTGGRLLEVNTQTGVPQQTWVLKTGQLTFYHQPFIYFVGTDNLVAGALYRADLTQTHPIPQRITKALPKTHFWLSVDGTTVFYADHSTSGAQGIYAVSSDGTDFRLLRAGPGIPIGYASDNALMVMEQTKNALQVIKMGALPRARETVVFANAAPLATSLCAPSAQEAVIAICDQNIALAPYGHGLLLHTWYANGTSGLVYDNLDTGTSRIIRSLPADASVQLPGWSKGSATGATASTWSDVVCLCA